MKTVQDFDIDSFTAPASKSRLTGVRETYKPARDQADEDISLTQKRAYHQSLQDSLNYVPELPPKIPESSFLVGKNAVQLYKSSRAINDTTIPLPQRPSTAIGIMSRTSVPSKPSLSGTKKVCCFKGCRLTNDEKHVTTFLHNCPFGKFCSRILEPEHSARFIHGNHDETDGRQNHTSRDQPTWWDSRYQNFQPRPSSVPRAGCRPAGGVAPDSDYVALEVTGIDRYWTDEEFADCMIHLAGPNSRCFRDSTRVIKSGDHFQNSGSGIAALGSYAEAENLIRCMEKHPYRQLRMKAKYATPVVKNGTDRIVESTQDLTSYNRPKTDPGALRYSKKIRDCGPYCDDAAALLNRMIREGHKPVLQNYIELIRSYRDAKPPQPSKAEQVLQQMFKQGLKHTIACNLVVDALCRAGYMKRAEELVVAMEQGGRKELTAPDHDTYRILIDGWARTGASESISTEGLYGVAPSDRRLAGSLGGGVIAADKPAAGVVAAWARRRSGFMPLSCGIMSERKPPVQEKGQGEEKEKECDIVSVLDKMASDNEVRIRPWRAVY